MIVSYDSQFFDADGYNMYYDSLTDCTNGIETAFMYQQIYCRPAVFASNFDTS